MLVSVIMPTYNAESFVAQAIRSLLPQPGHLQLDIIVVDDGSTDGTVRLVRGLARRHPEVRLIEASHRGISATRNRGLDALPEEAQLVSFQDADDLAYPGRIARQAALLKSDPDSEVVYGLIQMFDRLDDRALAPSPHARTLTTRAIHMSAGLYRRHVLDQVGRFDETLVQAEDTDYLFRLVESGARVVMEDQIATFYRRHDTNTSRDVMAARHEFMKAIHKSLKRRRLSEGRRVAPLVSGIFTDRARFEEQFEACPAIIPS
jgi:glycosyltransferase involved in cell wall biosynthesis